MYQNVKKLCYLLALSHKCTENTIFCWILKICMFFEPRNYKIEFPANKMYFTAIGTS